MNQFVRTFKSSTQNFGLSNQLSFLINLPVAVEKFKHYNKATQILSSNNESTPGTIYAIAEANVNSTLYNFTFIINEKTILNKINKSKRGFIVAQHLELEAAFMRHLSQELSILANVEFPRIHIGRNPIGLLMSVNFRPQLYAVAYKTGNPNKILHTEKNIIKEFENICMS